MSVKFEMYWSGPKTYGDWEIKTVDVKTPNLTDDHSAHFLDREIAGVAQNRLLFKVESRSGQSVAKTEYFAIEVPVDALKAYKIVWCGRIVEDPCFELMELSARIFKSYVDKSVLSMDAYSAYNQPIQAMREDLPISIESFPEFQAGATYKICVTNNGKELQATFSQKEEKEEVVRRKSNLLKEEYDPFPLRPGESIQEALQKFRESRNQPVILEASSLCKEKILTSEKTECKNAVQEEIPADEKFESGKVVQEEGSDESMCMIL